MMDGMRGMGDMMGDMMGGMMGWMVGGAMVIWTVFALLRLVVLALLAVLLFQQVRRGAGGRA